MTTHTPPAAPTPPGTPLSPAAPKRNTVGIIAFAASIIGFIFAVWEGAYLLGWVLLPIAFILALAGLFQKDASKKLAVAALIISIVGTIAGAVAFLGSAARAFDDALGTAPSTPVASAPAEPTPETEEASEPETQPEIQDTAQPELEAELEVETSDSTGPDGSRADPYPLGTTIGNNEWEVNVNSVTDDALDEILAENMFNDPPADGNVYVMANVTITRVAAEAGTAFEVGFHYVTDSGNVIGDYDAMVVAPDELGYNELYEGASETGNVVFEVPGEVSGTIRVRPGIFADDVFFATS